MEQRFTNFKQFVQAHIPHNPVTYLLQTMSLDIFFALLTRMRAANGPMTPREISRHVLTRLMINPTDFPPAALSKFELYIEYFDAATNAV